MKATKSLAALRKYLKKYRFWFKAVAILAVRDGANQKYAAEYPSVS
jgi:hypothetical protein